MLARPLLLLCLALPCSAQTAQQPSFAEAIRQTRAPLVLHDGHLTGSGGEMLKREIAASRFVLIGEAHLTHEIPQFAAAVCTEMRPDAYAVEASPLAARYVASQLHDPERIAHMHATLEAHPWNLAFLDIREENDLAASCAASSANGSFQLWGLDQEFLGSAGTLLDAMLATNPGPKSQAALHNAQDHERAAEHAGRRDGDFKQLYLIGIPDEDRLQIGTAIDSDGTPETALLWREFLESHRIYQLNLAHRGPESNFARARILKQHLMADYIPFHRYQPQGRVLFKFGAMHMGRGFDPLHELNLGNTVAELADVEGVHSLHISVLGVAGTSEYAGGYGKPLNREPFNLIGDKEIAWLGPALDSLLPATAGSGGTTLTLLDLRNLRFRNLDMASEWQQMIYSYDLLILVPNVTPATSLEPVY
jgi:hypothetical protein